MANAANALAGYGSKTAFYVDNPIGSNDVASTLRHGQFGGVYHESQALKSGFVLAGLRDAFLLRIRSYSAVDLLCVKHLLCPERAQNEADSLMMGATFLLLNNDIPWESNAAVLF